EGERRCRITGNDKNLGTVLLQIAAGFDGVLGNRFYGLRSVRQARGITKVAVVGMRNYFQQRFKNRQAAYTGIENANAGAARGCSEIRHAAPKYSRCALC